MPHSPHSPHSSHLPHRPARTTRSPRPPGSSPTLSAAVVAALLLLTACGAAGRNVRPVDPSKLKLDKRQRQVVRGTQASLEVPDSFDRAADRVWMLKQHGSLVFLLNVQRTPVPEQGADRALQQRIARVQRGGRAGLTRNEPVELGDLDGQYVEAIDLLGTNRHVLYQVVVETEDGVYVASLYAPIGLHKDHGKALAAIVRSLRVSP